MKPLQVGITGGIGAGKSMVCRIFQTLGVPIYDADSRARYLMTHDPVLINQIKNEFGDESYLADGNLHREWISKATFNDPERLKTLNGLVHPRVAVDYNAWVNKNADHPYVVREAALLYEVGADALIDKMIVVSAPEEVRIQRTLLRDKHRTEAEVKAIIKNQWPEEKKTERADYIINNDNQSMVIPQVLYLHSLFVSGATRR